MKVVIRPYQVGDAKKISDLFTRYSPYLRDSAYWVWINRLISEESSIVSVATVEDQLVGHYAVVPRSVFINDIEIKAGLGIHAFVQPEFRNLVSIFSVSSLAYKLAKEKGLDLIYGFPNVNYRLIQEKIEKWNCIKLFKALEKKIIPLEKTSLNYIWEQVNPLNGDQLLSINNLIEKERQKGAYLKKSISYILNRYLLHPQKLYQSFILKNGDNLCAFVVTKLFKRDRDICCHIIDLVLNDRLDLKLFLTDFEVYFSNVADISVQWPTTKNLYKELNQAGYYEIGFETFFGIKFLSDTLSEYKVNLLKFENWALYMGDSDAF